MPAIIDGLYYKYLTSIVIVNQTSVFDTWLIWNSYEVTHTFKLAINIIFEVNRVYIDSLTDFNEKLIRKRKKT